MINPVPAVRQLRPRPTPIPRNRTGNLKPHGRSRVSNGKQLFLDGQVRSKASRRFRDLLYAIGSDLGGIDHLSTGQTQLARRAALISVTCEEMEQAAVAGKEFDIETFGRLTDRLGRCFERLGLKREARDVTQTLEGYLEHAGEGLIIDEKSPA
jgi:hypothetical protein